MLHRFYGGVFPRDEKGATRRLARVPLDPPPARVILPLSMHVGAPCTPCVAQGDYVKIGQVIGLPVGAGTPVHASVSGLVAAVAPHPHPDGTAVLSVSIDNDYLNTRAPTLPPLPVYTELTPLELIARVAEAGIVGLSGAALPTHEKLRAAAGRVDTLILNGVECEPYVTADHRLMLEQTDDVLTGARMLLHALGAKRAFIGVAGNKADAVSALQSLLPLRGGNIAVKPLSARYPQGGERQLIQRVTGRRVPSGGTSLDVNCAVFNVATAAAVRAAVEGGLVLTERTVTVSGDGMANPQNFIVPIGTPIAHLIDAAGGLTDRAARVLTGGPMMGTAQLDFTVPVVKGTTAVLALSHRRLVARRDDRRCIRCGKCVTACPMRLLPLAIRERAAAGGEGLAKYHPEDCVSCGACTFVCPARFPLTQTIREVKERLLRTDDTEEGGDA